MDGRKESNAFYKHLRLFHPDAPGGIGNFDIKVMSVHKKPLTSSAQQVGFFNIGSGRVLDKIPGSRSGSGWVGVSENTIRYFRVPFLLSGISGYLGYVGYLRVFLGLPIYTRFFF